MSQMEYQAYLSRQSSPRMLEPKDTEETTEARLHNSIMNECGRRGWIALHGSMAHHTHRTVGEPDFVILADDGVVILVECKRHGAKLSSEQLSLRAWSNRLGHTVHVVHSMTEFHDVITTRTEKRQEASQQEARQDNISALREVVP